MERYQILLTPAVALMAMAFLFDFIQQRFSDSRWREPAFGLMFGGAIVLGMTNPIVLGDGLIFDTRSLLIGAAVAFVGAPAAAIALIIGIICRIVIGGAGLWAGLLGLVLAYAFAVGFVRLVYHRITHKPLADAALGGVVTLAAGAIFVLPYATATAVLTAILPTLFVSNAIGMVILGALFRHQIRQFTTRKELEKHAGTDPLTNLLNRRGLGKRAASISFDPAVGHAVHYFDVDNFKEINDRLGHDVGDAVLETLARRINENLRADAIFARHGGDEFSIYLPRVGEYDVKGIANRLCHLISDDPLELDGQHVPVTISMGVFWTKAALPIETMVSRADKQLLLAKQAGKNRAQVSYDRPSAQQYIA